ncbi:MAG TPA: response regulator [Kofleriaceae bacterium]|nr:response regulator [Kofleriaceae bacterium]
MPGTHTILLVEAPSSARDALAALLADEGYALSTADSGEQAVALIRADQPTVVIADLEAPNMTSSLARIMKLPRPPEVIALTEYGRIAPALEALRVGAADYVVKPIRADELSYVLAKAIEHYELTCELERLRAELVAARPLQ